MHCDSCYWTWRLHKIAGQVLSLAQPPGFQSTQDGLHDSRRLTCHRPQNPPPWPLQKVSPEPPRKASTTCKLDDMGQSTDHAAQESNPGSLLGVAWARLPERRAARHRRDFPARWYVVAGPGRWLGLNFHIREDVRRKGPWFPTPQTSGSSAASLFDILPPCPSRSWPRGTVPDCLSTQIFNINPAGSRIRRPHSTWTITLRHERVALVGPAASPPSPPRALLCRPLPGRLGLPAECLETGEKMAPMGCAFTLPCLRRHLCEAALNPLPENS